jgi:Uncharacterized protein conserved in bacteria
MARRDKDFLGLEVVSLEDASVIGEVDGLIVDETVAAVVGLIIDMGIHEAKVAAYSDLLSVGDDAVMVESSAVVRPISGHAALREVAEREVEVCDAYAITDKGDVVGAIGDYFVDPATGAIKGVEVIVEEDDEQVKVFVASASDIVRIGTDLVMIRAGFQSRAAASGDAL